MSMFFDGQLGAIQPVTTCNCLWGTAVIDQNGNCGCINDTEPVKQPPRLPLKVRQQPQIVYVQAPATTPPATTPATTPPATTTTAADDTIWGVPSWLVYVAGAGAGLYFLSQMGDKK